MTNRERVLALIRNHPGLTDSEIRQRTGISPHQQVNQICRTLAAAGLTRRITGPHGRIINVPIGSDTAGLQPAPNSPTLSRPIGRETPRPSNPRQPTTTLRTVLQPGTTMLVIPCSGSKQPGSGARGGTAILDVLPRPIAGELADLRRRNAVAAGIDDPRFAPPRNAMPGPSTKRRVPQLSNSRPRVPASSSSPADTAWFWPTSRSGCTNRCSDLRCGRIASSSDASVRSPRTLELGRWLEFCLRAPATPPCSAAPDGRPRQKCSSQVPKLPWEGW